MLAALGAANLHQQNFSLFLAVVMGLSILAVALFVLTAPRGGPDSE